MFRGIIGGPRRNKPKPFVRRINLPQEEPKDLIPVEEPKEKIEIVDPEEIIVEEAPVFKETLLPLKEEPQLKIETKSKKTYRKKTKKKK